MGQSFWSDLIEMMKKREYGDRVREVELASFTPLVFSTTGGMGREGTVFYRRLANLLADKQDWAYGTTIFIIIIITSTSDLQPSTAIANQLPGQ